MSQYRKVWETFDVPVRLRAVPKLNTCSCEDCYFYQYDGIKCSNYYDVIGQCEGKNREDGKDIFFVEV